MCISTETYVLTYLHVISCRIRRGYIFDRRESKEGRYIVKAAPGQVRKNRWTDGYESNNHREVVTDSYTLVSENLRSSYKDKGSMGLYHGVTITSRS